MSNPFKTAPRCVQWAAVLLLALPIFDALVALRIMPVTTFLGQWQLRLPPVALLWATALGLLWGIAVVRVAFAGLLVVGWFTKLVMLATFGTPTVGLVYESVWLALPAISLVLSFLPPANRYFAGSAETGSHPLVRPASRRTLVLVLVGAAAGAAAVFGFVLPSLRQARAVDQQHKEQERSIYREAEERAIARNLRMLAGAAAQHFLETSTTTASLADLVGPTRALRTLSPVAGETYPSTFQRDQPLEAVMPDGTHLMLDPQSGELVRRGSDRR